jgi:hypothetical protein
LSPVEGAQVVLEYATRNRTARSLTVREARRRTATTWCPGDANDGALRKEKRRCLIVDV